MNRNTSKVNPEKTDNIFRAGGGEGKPKPSPEPYDWFADFCVGRLPDSFRNRKIVLLCLLKALPKNHPRRPHVSEMLQLLRAHENARDGFIVPPRPEPKTGRRDCTGPKQ